MTHPNLPTGYWTDKHGSVPPGTKVSVILTRGIPKDGVFPEKPPTQAEYFEFLEHHARPGPIEMYDDETEKPALRANSILRRDTSQNSKRE